ncbi:hypothetical protein COB11_07505, partial [Candidatus Aerophobetes bacterium]
MSITPTTHYRIPQLERLPQEDVEELVKYQVADSTVRPWFTPLISLDTVKIESLVTLICKKVPSEKQQNLLGKISDIFAGQIFHNNNNTPNNLHNHFPQLKAFSEKVLSILRKMENPPLALMKKIKDNFIMIAVMKNKIEAVQENKGPLLKSMSLYLGAKDILTFLEIHELDESILLRSMKASIFINTFIKHC